MALFNPVEYRTRFKDHCQAISGLLTTPLGTSLVETYDTDFVHSIAQTRVKPDKAVMLDTHIKLWIDWESTIYLCGDACIRWAKMTQDERLEVLK